MRHETGILVVPDGLDCVTLSVGTTPTGLAALVFPAHHLRRTVIQTTQPVRWIASPDSPSASFGLLLRDGDTLVYDGSINTLTFVRDASASGDALLTVHYFGLT